MPESKIVEECDGCGFPDVEAWPCSTHTRRFNKLDDLWLCDVCRTTMCGNAALYPTNSVPESYALRSIAAATNMILAAIKASKEAPHD